ncbi:MAG: hypothetical protein IPK15_27435 [Verrucomicrobia bacterium]|nr:hypothetical protein [Verrucomicrobiota bacterium]
MSFREVKRQEAQKPHGGGSPGAAQSAGSSGGATARFTGGNGAKWRITNLLQFARAMSRWA